MKFGKGYENCTPAEQARIAIGRQVAAEGMVLLENNSTLPLKAGAKTALFGVGQIGFLHGGSGSGGTFADYVVKMPEAMENAGAVVDREILDYYTDYCTEQQKEVEKIPPFMRRGTIPELPVPPALIEQAAARNDAAVFVLSRLAGEGRDRTLTPGDYYLDETEIAVLSALRGAFRKVIVVLNICGIIDMEWVDTLKPDAVLCAWIPGQEGASAAADILMGHENPSGRLTDTVPKAWKDVPSSENFGAWADGFELYTGDENQIPYWGGVGNHEAVPMGKTVVRPVGNRRYTEYQEGLYVGYRYFTTFGVPVRYPFGYGLSYSEFTRETKNFSFDGETIRFDVVVWNEGPLCGKEVVQIYLNAPQEPLERPERELIAFQKTGEIQPGFGWELNFEIPLRNLAVYSEQEAAWVLQTGRNTLYIGGNALENVPFGEFDTEAAVLEQVENRVTPAHHTRPLRQLSRRDPKGTYPIAPPIRADSAEQHGSQKPDNFTWPEISHATGKYLLKDVLAGKCTMEEFVRQADDFELTVLLIGSNVTKVDANNTQEKTSDAGPADYMAEVQKESQLGPLSELVPGMSGYTATIDRLGVPTITMSDGPAGFVGGWKKSKLAFPTATITACTFNQKLAEQLGDALGGEAEERGIDVWLAPAMNIHRNPLAGRNYEYYSEDPLVAGKIAAAVIRGAEQNHPISTCVKHFAANNQETSRWDKDDSIIAERVLREIYLRGFEIAVKEGHPHSLMTSYNPLNGKQTACHEELLDGILRQEWGFDGFVVTDWEGDTGLAVECLEAGNDLLMPGFPGMVDYVYRQRLNGRLSRAALEDCAARLLKVVMHSAAMERYLDRNA